MRLAIRLIAVLCFTIVLGQALLLRHATQGSLFTQLPSASLARMQEAAPADDTFAELGLNDLSGEPTKVDNEFRLGLLPAGTGNSFGDAASVLTFAGPALVLLVLTLWFTRPRKDVPAAREKRSANNPA